jgi:AraC family transcriptional regulator, arabinose operon regulatory protein
MTKNLVKLERNTLRVGEMESIIEITEIKWNLYRSMLLMKMKDTLQILRTGAGTVVYPPGGHCGPRVQINFQLVLLHTGKMDVCINGTSYQVPPGHLCLLEPGAEEEFLFAKEQETWHRWIDIHVNNISSDMLKKMKFLPYFMPISDSMNKLTDLMLSMQQAGHLGNSDVLCSLGATALELFIEEAQSQDTLNKFNHPAVLMAKSIIQNRFTEDLTIAEVADEVSISTDHLVRLFRKQEGVSPSHYLWERRMVRGLELLRNTGLTVSEIAYQSGFKTSQHFARAIKQYTNLTPTEVRNESVKEVY